MPVMVAVSNSMLSHLTYVFKVTTQNPVAASILQNQHVRQMVRLVLVLISDKRAFHSQAIINFNANTLIQKAVN